MFRRAVLDEVGGFDETFDYYLDETDSVRAIVDAGYVLRQLDDAHMHHKFLPSAMRNEGRIVTNWYPILKNLTYFGYRHALDDRGGDAILEKANAEPRSGSRNHAPTNSPAVSRRHRGRVATDGARAIDEGRRRGIEAGAGPLPHMGLDSSDIQPFRPFPVNDRRARSSRSCHRRSVTP